MARCPNCGQKTTGSGDYCQYCSYPILAGSRVRQQRAQALAKKQAEEVEKRAKKEAERLAKEQAKRDAEDARKRQEEEKLAKVETEKRMSKEAEKEKQVIYSLGQIEKVCEELKAGKMGTKEALEKLEDLSDKIPE